ncbi:Pre-mRNA polyadenylation factor [Cryptosporidium canis]|uniref:Pre-mRNA polyadenylation factor n=1 Tax=Cryptosporidium canis TaxID=195482 RepID=A0A9D5DFK1_9CRYT|nr:Pre-mRNA polyadenylation factor [Cryptosporidium canis]
MSGGTPESSMQKSIKERNETNEEIEEDDEEDVTFLICGGNDQGGLKDFSKLKDGSGQTNNGDASSSTQDPSKKTSSDTKYANTGTNGGVSSSTSNQRASTSEKNQHALNASDTVYIESEASDVNENPCKDLQMVWENNPEKRPWSRVLDVSPWFNYGFNEKTFKEYIIKQLGIRWERVKKQNIETSDDLLHKNTLPSGISNPNGPNHNPGIPNSNIKMMNGMPPPPMAGFPPNMMYFPLPIPPPIPPPHLNPPIPGHPNVYHQQHMFNNFPQHLPPHAHIPPPIPPHQVMHHPGIPTNNINPNPNGSFNARGKKRPPE